MQILLVRHGIATARAPGAQVDDGKRPLTDRGRRRMEENAEGLARLLPRPGAIFTSPLVRALQTADLLSAAWGGKPRPQVTDALTPGQPVPRAVAWLAAETSHDLVVAVGHEPDLSRLLARLVASRAGLRVDFKKGGVALIEIDPAAPGTGGKLAWFVPPRLLRWRRR